MTIKLTLWRKQFRADMNKQDNKWHDRITDSLVNFETVKCVLLSPLFDAYQIICARLIILLLVSAPVPSSAWTRPCALLQVFWQRGVRADAVQG